MTIRFTCDQCGSVLKIKDELAGTDGKCPKCKKRFVVPEAGEPEPSKTADAAVAADSPDDIAAAALADPKPSPPKAPESKPAAKTPDKPGKPSKKLAADEDFDPVSFLMDGPKKKAAFEPDEPELPKTPMAGGRGSAPVGGGFSLDDDEDAPPEPPVPTKKWGAKKDSSAAASADKSLGGSTGAAKDLLAKSMEESRIRAAEMPEEQPRFTFDFAGFFREFGLKAGGIVGGTIAGCVLLYWVMNSMIGSKLALPELGYVSGRVTIKGQPHAGIRVYFSPKVSTIDEKKSNQKARDSFGTTDADGNYTLYYTAEIPGVKVGQCRVYMEADDPKIPIPAKFLGYTANTTVEVQSGNNPPQNFEL